MILSIVCLFVADTSSANEQPATVEPEQIADKQQAELSPSASLDYTAVKVTCNVVIDR